MGKKIKKIPTGNKNEKESNLFWGTLTNIKKTVSFVAKYEKWRLTLLIIFSAVTASIPYLQNGLFAKLVDSTIAFKNNTAGLQSVLVVVFLLIFSTILPNLISIVEGFVFTVFQFNIMSRIDLHFFKKSSELDIATIESSAYQELRQKATERGGSSTIFQFLDMCIDNLGNLVAVTLSLSILAFIDKTLLIYAFIGCAPVLYVQIKYGRNMTWIVSRNSKHRRKYLNRRDHFEESLELTEMKLYQLSKKFLNDIKYMLESFNDELRVAERNRLMWEIFAQLIFSLFIGLGIWRIISLTLGGQLPIGEMLFAFSTYRGFKSTLAVFFRKTGNITEYGTYVGYWFAIDELKPVITSMPNSPEFNFKNNPPTIEFRNVKFRYEKSHKKYTLDDLSFKIDAGNKIAIVGLSGAGKTTLIKLLCRVFDPESGQILINGVDLRELNLNSWQKQLAVLFQDFATYEFTVSEAIALGEADSTESKINNKRVVNAAKMAKADIFIDRLPKKYNQLLWKGYDDGVDLSKGEKQRMALARVLYRESPITILDEPTASVDALAEQEIFETLERLPNDRTVILISHRFSTVKNADKILVIEHGKLIEEGTHQQLMLENGRYSELYKVQADSYK